MATITQMGTGLALTGLLLMTGAAHALSPADKCEASKLSAAGKYDLCRMEAQAKAVKRGGSPDFTKCDAAYSSKWTQAETSAGGMCPSNGDEGAVRAFITEHTEALEAALDGGALPEGVLSCNSDLATCNGHYATCSDGLTTCNGNLTACDASLATVSSGNAAPADVLSGKTFSSGAGLSLTGTVPAGSAVNGANGLKTFTIPDGLYAGSRTATANDTNLAAGNIITGVSILGVTGTQSPAQPLKTGQTISYAAGDDGASQKGAALSYTDNADGTITDNKTGLMWEKKVQLDGTTDGTNLHDADDTYPWAGDCSSESACYSGGPCCQTSSDCVSPETCTISDGEGTGLTIFGWVAQLNLASFAGHNDWRIPNRKELESIRDDGTANPAVAPEFQGASCGGACADLARPACSCTQSTLYWSSTTYQPFPLLAWPVTFGDSALFTTHKSDYNYVRAVRGGL